MDKTKGQEIKGISFQTLNLESTAFSVRFNIMVEGGREQSRKEFNKTLCQTEILPTFQTV